MQTSPRELSTLPRLLWVSFRGTVGTFVGIVGMLAGIAAWFIPGTTTVTLAVYVVTVALCVAIIVVLFEATRIARLHAANPLPRVCLSLREGGTPTEGHVILILEPSPMFSHGLMASIFLLEHGHYERFVGHGVVQNVQDDGLIQIRIEEVVEGFQSLIADLEASKSQVLSRLRVKPYVQQRGRINFMETGYDTRA
ncbi:MAG: hypothetical protein Q8J90_11265 [Gallionella sp.]|nr:hypothetical protein [Gallionella sp.]